ncbi:MAG TPA: hypothetical protein VJG83_05350 [archaeon]|nr:hypothetical protein [archaeon]
MRYLAYIGFLLLFSNIVFAQYAWDNLRPITDFAKEVDLPVKVAVFVLSVAIFAISLLAYSKSKSKRIMLISFAFFLFSAKWLVKVIDVFYSPGTFLSDSSENLFDFGILACLFLALFYKRSSGPFEKGP